MDFRMPGVRLRSATVSVAASFGCRCSNNIKQAALRTLLHPGALRDRGVAGVRYPEIILRIAQDAPPRYLGGDARPADCQSAPQFLGKNQNTGRSPDE